MKRRETFLAGFVLVLTTLVLYWPVTHYPFVVIDDDEYVSENPWAAKGITLASLKWAFSTAHAANWHPVTWISHLLDYSTYGLFAGGHHLTSLVLHALNTLLVFLLLKRLTKLFWPAFVVAGLFGWHPLHVESVAWVAERKDVLSTFFFLLTVWAYCDYVERFRAARPTARGVDSSHPTPGNETPLQSAHAGDASGLRDRLLTIRNSPAFSYLLALVFFAIGLMCKPMLVTLPFVLLLLDYWPLSRLSVVAAPPGDSPFPQAASASSLTPTFVPLLRLCREKLAFFALSLAACVATLVAQHAGGAMKSVEEVPVLLRVFNALVSVLGYLSHTFYPVGLCVFYPLPEAPPILIGIISGGVIGVVTWFFYARRSECPWAFVGWLWFLGTLMPVLGLVQVGLQAMADRYTYIPSIGLFLVIVWGAVEVLKRKRAAPNVAVAVALVPSIACLALARAQLEYWRDSVALCSRAVAVTTRNAFAENGLGIALAKQGNSAAAIQHYSAALRIKSNSAPFHYNLGLELAAIGRSDEALLHFSQALELNPRSAILHNNIGAILAQQGKLGPAQEHFLKAMELDPEYPKPYLNYAIALQKQGEAGAAFTNYNKALRLDSEWPDALNRLAYLLALCPDGRWRNQPAAVKLAERACNLSLHQVPAFLETLAITYAKAEQFSNAIPVAELARERARQLDDQVVVQKLERELRFYSTNQLPPLDWRSP